MSIEKKIKEEVNKIIRSLYKPDGKVDLEKIQKEQLYGAAVNWGDLKCVYVEKAYVVYVEEADPTAYSLQQYIEKEMKKKGYKVKVITEW